MAQGFQMLRAENIPDPAIHVTSIEDLLTGAGLTFLLQHLMTYLPRQRWFGAKSRKITAIAVLDSAQSPGINGALVYLQISYEDGSTDVYQLPVGISSETEGTQPDPDRIIAIVNTPAGSAIVHDAVGREDVRQAILNLIATEGQ